MWDPCVIPLLPHLSPSCPPLQALVCSGPTSAAGTSPRTRSSGEWRAPAAAVDKLFTAVARRLGGLASHMRSANSRSSTTFGPAPSATQRGPRAPSTPPARETLARLFGRASSLWTKPCILSRFSPSFSSVLQRFPRAVLIGFILQGAPYQTLTQSTPLECMHFILD